VSNEFKFEDLNKIKTNLETSHNSSVNFSRSAWASLSFMIIKLPFITDHRNVAESKSEEIVFQGPRRAIVEGSVGKIASRQKRKLEIHSILSRTGIKKRSIINYHSFLVVPYRKFVLKRILKISWPFAEVLWSNLSDWTLQGRKRRKRLFIIKLYSQTMVNFLVATCFGVQILEEIFHWGMFESEKSGRKRPHLASKRG